MLNRIFSRLMFQAKLHWQALALVAVLVLIATAYIVVAYKPSLGPLQKYLPQAANQTSMCDVMLMDTISGHPGDDQATYDCLTSLPSGPKNVAEVTSVRRSNSSQPREYTKIGTFNTDGRSNAGGQAVVYMMRDNFPETVVTIYLTPDGQVQGFV